LFLLDAMALIYRAYYALIRNPRFTSAGKNTGTQFGFTNTLLELLNKYKPTYIAVCFDTHAPTERHIRFEQYKANRPKAPEDLLSAIPDVKDIIRAFNIPCIECDGYEADDIIGTLAWQASDKGCKVFMVTPDKDYGQLLTKPDVFIYKPAHMGNKEEILTAEKICEKWDIARVEQITDLLGLMGDKVDNIPGIAGIGEKTAAKLLKQYDTLENVLANADSISGLLGEKIRAGKEDAVLSKKLATIITDVPVTFKEEEFSLKEINKDALAEVFSRLEFRTIGKRVLGESFTIAAPENVQTDLFGNIVKSKENKPAATKEIAKESIVELASNYKTIKDVSHHYHVVDTDEKIKSLVQNLSAYAEICFDTETTGTNPNNVELVALSFSVKKHEAFYIPISANQIEAQHQLDLFDSLFNDEKILWIGQNLKYDLIVIKWYGKTLAGNIFDTMVADYLIEPESRRGMDFLSEKYLNYTPVPIEELIGKKGKNQGNMRDVALDKISEYAAEDADVTLQLKEVFVPLIKKFEVEKVFNQADAPLVKVLANMEFEGVKIDVDFLKNYSEVLDADAKKFEENVYKKAGTEFNLASPKQLGEILFEKLKLDPKAKKTKTGQYATGEDVLTKLAVQHEIAADILAFRELAKLKNTYADALPELINPKTGRVHTSYNQTVVVTGRLSSNNPNLQNIPVRTERGKEIRKAFIPRDEKHVLVSADYSQIELRIVAAISGDKHMSEAFRSGADIHAATAAKVYGVDISAVTKEQRRKAKSVNFGIIYGQSAFGLAQNIGVSRTEAKEIIDNYLSEFSGIAQYMNDTVAFAKQHGYVQTLLGRKAWLRDINSANFTVRSFAERNAINSPIQGSAADMIKLAMIGIDKAFEARKLQSKMILQVHDELVFDVAKNELDEVKEIVLTYMRNALPLPNDVPVDAEIGVGQNWLEAH